MHTNSEEVPPSLNVPKSWLQSVDGCPVCACTTKTLLIAGLTDVNYGCVSGKWTFYRCGNCGSAYLNPRIDATHIAQAYGSYETHGAFTEPPRAGPLRRFVKRVRDAYLSRRYGLPGDSSSGFLSGLMYLLPPPLRAEWDFFMRHSPKGSGLSVLDVGCGNGDFLLRMRRAGWSVHGVDFDPAAVAVARGRGLDVKLKTAEEIVMDCQTYDLVTASHVVEHVHDPASFLRILYSKVSPGGRLWIATPNLDSVIRRLLKEYWRNWETPRHLIIFSQASLRGLFASALGETATFRPRGWHVQWSLAQGRHLRIYHRLGVRPKLPGYAKPLAWAIEFAAWLAPRFGDELVVEVSKPRV